MSISRREFLESTFFSSLAAGSLLGASAALPTRMLGNTGFRVSILALGGGSRFMQFNDDEAVAAITRALDLGVNYIDTSDDYGRNHGSEERIGKALKGRRRDVFLVTKLSNRDGKESRRIVEASLKALQVDQLDLLHIHSLTSPEDLEQIEAKGGVLEQVMKLRDSKLTRFIGITSHAHPLALKTALERHAFDVTQMALNAGQVAMMNGKTGMVTNPEMRESFETTALPVANRKKMGVIAMKVFAQDALLKQARPEKLLYYSLSLPVSAAVVGMQNMKLIEENVRLAKAFTPLPKSEMKKLASVLSERNKLALDLLFAHHVDG